MVVVLRPVVVVVGGVDGAPLPGRKAEDGAHGWRHCCGRLLINWVSGSIYGNQVIRILVSVQSNLADVIALSSMGTPEEGHSVWRELIQKRMIIT